MTLEWPEKPNCSTGHPACHMDKHRWDEPRDAKRYRACSFCGSIHPEELVRILQDDNTKMLTPGEHSEILKGLGPGLPGLRDALPPIKIEWADFKYGFPHKLYIETNRGESKHGKFYTKHLVEIEGEAFELLSRLLAEKAYVLFWREESRVRWRTLPMDGKN